MEKHLHLVAFDVPYPPDYGGTIEIFFKLKALHYQGIKVHLHCFQYGREQSAELRKICESVHYYSRKSTIKSIFSFFPFIVLSRMNPDLLENLKADAYPVLFEGLHTCGYLNHKQLAGKQRLVRLHNIEWKYYSGLASNSPISFRWLYYKIESFRLKKFEPILKFADVLLTISTTDQDYFKQRFRNSVLLNPFHGNTEVCSKTGIGDYALYHGNLGVEENDVAAQWIVNNLTKKIRLVIAGKNPSTDLKKVISKRPDTELIENPGSIQMENLVQNAHLLILPAFQESGIKLKLIHSLFKGRFVIVNSKMISGTGLDYLCDIFENQKQLNQLIEEMLKKPFTVDDKAKRKSKLLDFNDQLTVNRLIHIISFKNEASLS